jgi:hypothetical protein
MNSIKELIYMEITQREKPFQNHVVLSKFVRISKSFGSGIRLHIEKLVPNKGMSSMIF